MKMIILAAGLGTRLASVTQGRPKHLVDVGGMTLLERLMAMAASSGLEPVVVTRPEFVADFRRFGPEVWAEDDSDDMMITLSHTRARLHEPFAWVGGDMLFTDYSPVRDLVREHIETGSQCSLLYNRTDRFKAKLQFNPEPEIVLTRQGAYPFSLLNFAVHTPRVFDYLPGDLGDPKGTYLQKALDHGEPILLREYHAKAFEIDTPADLAEARLYFEDLARAS
jgi:NDP-sugar pyrophosphorylase family protein